MARIPKRTPQRTGAPPPITSGTEAAQEVWDLGVKAGDAIIETASDIGAAAIATEKSAIESITGGEDTEPPVNNPYIYKTTPPPTACTNCDKTSTNEGVEANAGSAQTQIDPTSEEARKHLDSEDWSYKTNRPPYPRNTNKCNLFVYEMLNKTGKPVPMKKRLSISHFPIAEHPPLAGQWADPSVDIPGWKVVTTTQPGDVAAIAKDYSDATGHVGIVSSSNTTISATGTTVVEND